MNDLDWDDIGYSFLVGGDGNIYEGCGWIHKGADMLTYNNKSISIAFIGNFSRKQAKQNMLDAVHQLIEIGKSSGVLQRNVRVVGAQQVLSLNSPGKKLYQQIQTWPE